MPITDMPPGNHVAATIHNAASSWKQDGPTRSQTRFAFPHEQSTPSATVRHEGDRGMRAER
jgi:hypothetical protein